MKPALIVAQVGNVEAPKQKGMSNQKVTPSGSSSFRSVLSKQQTSSKVKEKQLSPSGQSDQVRQPSKVDLKPVASSSEKQVVSVPGEGQGVKGTEPTDVLSSHLNAPLDWKKILQSLQLSLVSAQQQLSASASPPTQIDQSLLDKLQTIINVLESPSTNTGLLSKKNLEMLQKELQALTALMKKQSDVTKDQPVWQALSAVFQTVQNTIQNQTLSVDSGDKNPLPISQSTSLQMNLGVASIKTQHSELLTPGNPSTSQDPAKSVRPVSVGSMFSLKSDTNDIQEKPNSSRDGKKASNGDSIVMDLLGNSRQMGKVQQFLFHNQTAATLPPTPDQQIANQIKTWFAQGAIRTTNGQMSMDIQLHPNNLGSVQLTITQSENGLVASITAHSSATKDLLDMQLNHLQQSLVATGINVHKIDVMLAPGSQGTPSDTLPQQSQQDQGHPQNSEQQNASTLEDTNQEESFETWLRNEVI